jgi:hypothetical protein
MAATSGNPELARVIKGISKRIHFVRQIDLNSSNWTVFG